MSKRHFVIGPIPEKYNSFFRDLNLQKGDVLEVGERGFPENVDIADPPPVVLRRTLHPNIAAVLAQSEVLQEKGKEVPHA